jgi:hypothetical protein
VRARLILNQLIASHDETYTSISTLLGRNPAYIQQFIKRGTPRTLSMHDQAVLAAHFCMPADFLRGPVPDSAPDRLDQVTTLIRMAIAGCERMGKTLAIGHLQLGLDVLEQGR